MMSHLCCDGKVTGKTMSNTPHTVMTFDKLNHLPKPVQLYTSCYIKTDWAEDQISDISQLLAKAYSQQLDSLGLPV